MDKLHEKLENLKGNLRSLGSVAVAFSGGVDSAFLLKVAHDVLGDQAAAVTACSVSFPERELEESREFCKKEGIRHYICQVDQMQIAGFRQNPPDRCYICKKEIFAAIGKTGKEHCIKHIVEGSNVDDTGDYRPGLRAVAESGAKSPLREAGMTKQDIRLLSRELQLPTWDKPSFACLATRFVYGEEITPEKLKMVEEAEQLLYDLGFGQFRVRMHGRMARIEVLPETFPKLMQEDTRRKITDGLLSLGFTYVTLDLAGYRTGSMNEIFHQGNIGVQI